MGYFREVFPKLLCYPLAYRGLVPPGMPINLTFSVTNLCQSKCKTCSIWRLYREHPDKLKAELSLDEIERIFMTMGHIYVFNISGGEPFLRNDIAEIIALACKYLTPGIVHIPTNAISPRLVLKRIRPILKILKTKYPHVRLTIKPSLDHIGDSHDKIRGVKGNFEKVIGLFNRLKAYKADYPNLHVELGTVISRWNITEIAEISEFAIDLSADSYRNEIAEHRSEMFNMDDSITPNPAEYRQAVEFFVARIKRDMKERVLFERITHAFRLIYYQLAIRIMEERRQIIPCYAGISNAHMTPYGDIWACCTLGYEKSMGNLRDFGYDFKRLWAGAEAQEIRDFISGGNCFCPLANQAYSNILLHPPSLACVVKEIVKARDK
ncbi:radical SAM domain protein [delta proteobacterium NaphS2]|nr:radical SAM domain protein [delta proteobacterium NaphS2]